MTDLKMESRRFLDDDAAVFPQLGGKRYACEQAEDEEAERAWLGRRWNPT